MSIIMFWEICPEGVEGVVGLFYRNRRMLCLCEYIYSLDI